MEAATASSVLGLRREGLRHGALLFLHTAAPSNRHVLSELLTDSLPDNTSNVSFAVLYADIFSVVC